MEAWFIIVVSLCIAALLRSIFTLFNNSKKNLPPGPPSFPLIGNLVWLRKRISDLEFILRQLKPQYGPLITMKIAHRTFVFVGSHSLAHQALVNNGAVFADRHVRPTTAKILNRAQKAISSSSYGPTWRLLRRNLTHEILHASRVRSYSSSRRWVLSLLIHRLRCTAQSESSVKLIDHFQFAMFSLLVLMCFGDKLQENQIKEIETVQRSILVGFRRFDVLNFWPRLGKILFRKRWKELLHVDTLVNLQLPEENRKLHEEEIVSLCSEFLSAGTDTTSTALQWVMANLVKYPQIQEKLYQEIISVVGQPPRADSDSNQQVVEEDLQKMPYLKAVVLEALRRHPPVHFVLPHKVTQDVELDGYMIPKDALVNFTVADMGWDPKVWEDPMEFKPERFLANGEAFDFDITGSREIKMMPFGAGRRICPGYALALLHLEYFVANLIWYFEWTPLDGEEVDLSEKQEFTTVMKNPLRARISSRSM